MKYEKSMEGVRRYAMALQDIGFLHPGALVERTYRNYSIQFLSMVHNSLREMRGLHPITFEKKEDICLKTYNIFGNGQEEDILIYKIYCYVMSQHKVVGSKSYMEVATEVTELAKRWVFFFSHLGCVNILNTFDEFRIVLMRYAGCNGVYQEKLFEEEVLG